MDVTPQLNNNMKRRTSPVSTTKVLANRQAHVPSAAGPSCLSSLPFVACLTHSLHLVWRHYISFYDRMNLNSTSMTPVQYFKAKEAHIAHCTTTILLINEPNWFVFIRQANPIIAIIERAVKCRHSLQLRLTQHFWETQGDKLCRHERALPWQCMAYGLEPQSHY